LHTCSGARDTAIVLSGCACFEADACYSLFMGCRGCRPQYTPQTQRAVTRESGGLADVDLCLLATQAVNVSLVCGPFPSGPSLLRLVCRPGNSKVTTNPRAVSKRCSCSQGRRSAFTTPLFEHTAPVSAAQNWSGLPQQTNSTGESHRPRGPGAPRGAPCLQRR